MNSRALQNQKYLKNPLVSAFLETIAKSEGANYGTLVYGKPFNNDIVTRGFGFNQHPALKGFMGKLPGRPNSSASGKYQFLRATWVGLQQQLALTDFLPDSQDIGAVELLRQRGALPFVLKNDFPGAVNAARKEWASLPGAGYGQHENNLANLQSYFQKMLDGGAQAVKTIGDNAGAATFGISGGLIFFIIGAVLILRK